jgi:hypothetical protein
MKWFLLILVNWIASICNLFLAPFVVMFVTDEGRLPQWLHWFDTPDNPLSAQVIDRWFPEHDTKFKRWINNVSWLYRNSMYGFSEDVLGFTIKEGFTYSCVGDESVSNKPLHEGLVKRYLTQGGKTYWQWYYVKPWGPVKWRRCIRANFGWKIWGDKQVGMKEQIVCSINPLMGWLK